ncbi:response regulator [Glycomyces algeriensis]|uniref:DNA-binding response regulator n=1 Tax=Glycomyces algeriensis TaxID=256037 RepID=A0A9W6LHK7_9ACTN|nr:response regulator transcription factor [Glycomyces algeriensis]MDA1365719.1 response regulator transcription factor [Glycomyces algeriensis]MDR7351407.1 DNA-binding NarL/FixJ family response regulator [Glycomyces algeriensis]GLI44127.1 DNA-binding response regulator [Glycomyces algeriensis]
MTIRVVVADDEPLVRAGLRMVLRPAADIEVVAEAGDGREALDAVAAYRPDVALIDIRMPCMDGLGVLRELKRRNLAVAAVMLTTFDLDDYLHTALAEGAVGFLLKDTPPRKLADAVRAAAAGEAMLSPAVTRRLVDAYIRQPPAAARAATGRLSALTARERTVAAEVARGRSNAQIARALGITETSVKAHVSRILTKLGLENRVQVALLVRDAGD